MKIGLLACSSNTGLGYQTRDFFNYIKCNKTLIYDISTANGMPVDHEWASGSIHKITKGLPTNEECEWLVDDMDLIFVAETPLNYYLFEYARKKCVKIVLQYNYEFLQYIRNMALPVPDVFASPSHWEIQKVKDLGLSRVEYLPVPVVTEFRKPEIKKTVNRILHVAGRPAMHDRNGTSEFLEMIQDKIFLLSEYRHIQFKICMQKPREANTIALYEKMRPRIEKAKHQLGERLEIVWDAENQDQMFGDSDMMVLPRKYGGLCLPLWEAMSYGLPVIMTKIAPNDAVLPDNWLAKSSFIGYFETHSPISMYRADVDSLLSKTIRMINSIEKDSETAIGLAKAMSWDERKSHYMELFRDICIS